MRDDGYEFALTNVRPTTQLEPLLELVGIVKLDYAALGPEGIAAAAERLRPRGVTLVAEKIETLDAFDFALVRDAISFRVISSVVLS